MNFGSRFSESPLPLRVWQLAGCCVLLAPLYFSGCAAAPSPSSPSAASAAITASVQAPSLDDLQAELHVLEERIARTEERKAEWIADALERRELALQEEDALARSLDAALEQIDVLERQRSLKQRQLEAGLSEEELQALRTELDALEVERHELEAERQRQERRLDEVRQRLESVRDLDGQALFRLETDDLYRRATELQNEIYQQLIDRTASFITSPSQQEAFTRLYQERIDARDATLSAQGISGERFHELVTEFQRDRNLGTALLSSRTFRLEFQLGRAEVVPAQAADFRSLAEALLDASQRDFDYLVFIDGHADSVTYPGGACLSALRNRQLSQERAEAARDLLVDLGLPIERLRLDWFGNFLMASSPSGDAGGEPENRRVEIRVTSREAGEYTSHQDYFRMHRELPLLGRTFLRDVGRWIDTSCSQQPEELTWPYMGAEYQDLAARLELARHYPLVVSDEGHEYLLWLGNDVTVRVDDRCVRVRGCGGGAVELPLEDAGAALGP